MRIIWIIDWILDLIISGNISTKISAGPHSGSFMSFTVRRALMESENLILKSVFIKKNTDSTTDQCKN